ncbi:hypothetical protein CEUSTIGMA_g8916.t1 [Chlamydomonas eustigma]|uniref:Uncharacterized protein n=1 Tax=Chlamydomonas eustigma TaxID=1157962 RepID=A0A250XEI6_9CHLO|nr:hypothetical protein CEUSTIGMA_g8916.t1 [Chlamydomonas eustigma]|eukprot:GAX81487.1 hypothetical protein CEUSTIGMA_g8916.t1 [Chlamydomonas eustigma]
MPSPEESRWNKAVPHDLSSNIKRQIHGNATMLPEAKLPLLQCVECKNAIEWVNTLPEDMRGSVIKHSRRVDRVIQTSFQAPDAINYYRSQGFDPRKQILPSGQFNMLDPGVTVIQSPTCWSCQPKLSEQDYQALRVRVLREKLAAAGHPIPYIPAGPIPKPYSPTANPTLPPWDPRHHRHAPHMAATSLPALVFEASPTAAPIVHPLGTLSPVTTTSAAAPTGAVAPQLAAHPAASYPQRTEAHACCWCFTCCRSTKVQQDLPVAAAPLAGSAPLLEQQQQWQQQYPSAAAPLQQHLPMAISHGIPESGQPQGADQFSRQAPPPSSLPMRQQYDQALVAPAQYSIVQQQFPPPNAQHAGPLQEMQHSAMQIESAVAEAPSMGPPQAQPAPVPAPPHPPRELSSAISPGRNEPTSPTDSTLASPAKRQGFLKRLFGGSSNNKPTSQTEDIASSPTSQIGSNQVSPTAVQNSVTVPAAPSKAADERTLDSVQKPAIQKTGQSFVGRMFSGMFRGKQQQPTMMSDELAASNEPLSQLQPPELPSEGQAEAQLQSVQAYMGQPAVLTPGSEQTHGLSVVNDDTQQAQAQPLVNQGMQQAQAQPLVNQDMQQAQAQPLVNQDMQQAQAQPLVNQGMQQAQAQPLVNQGMQQAQAQPFVNQDMQQAQARPLVNQGMQPAQAQPLVNQGMQPAQAQPLVNQGMQQAQAQPLVNQGMQQAQAQPFVNQDMQQAQAQPFVNQDMQQAQAQPFVNQGMQQAQAQTAMSQGMAEGQHLHAITPPSPQLAPLEGRSIPAPTNSTPSLSTLSNYEAEGQPSSTSMPPKLAPLLSPLTPPHSSPLQGPSGSALLKDNNSASAGPHDELSVDPSTCSGYISQLDPPTHKLHNENDVAIPPHKLGYQHAIDDDVDTEELL